MHSFKKFFFLTLILNIVVHAQNETDALRYALFDNYNTAGISSLGGAGGLLSPSHNPASLGFFGGTQQEKQVISISIGNSNKTMESNYLNQHTIRETPPDIIPFIQNIGYAYSKPIKNSNWDRINMCLSFNKKRDFNQEVVINGFNSNSSLSTLFLQNSQGLTPDELDPWSDYLAFFTYLTDTIANWNGTGPNTSYFSYVNNIGQNQTIFINEEGAIHEMDITLSSAYNNFLFIGASIGITSIDFYQRTSYLEDEFDAKSNEIESFQYNQYLKVNGDGVNFKFGAFIKPISFKKNNIGLHLRTGWAYHSKTYNSLEEVYETSMQTIFENGDIFDANSPTNLFNYDLNTPAKSISSIAIIGNLKKINFLTTFDYEAIDYGSSELHSAYYSFNSENDNISNFYARTNNTKLGVSVSLNNISFRGGYSIFESPYTDGLNDGKREYLTTGIGLKYDNWIFDISLIQCTSQEDYIVYRDNSISNPDQIASINNQNNMVIATCSFTF